MAEPSRVASLPSLSTEEHRALAETEKSAALDALVEGVSHNVRTPLTAIQNHAFLLKRRLGAAREAGAPPTEEDLRLVERLVRAVDRLADVVRDLRHLSGLDPIRVEPSPLDTIVREALELFEATRDPRVALETHVAPTPPVSLDRSWVLLALLNILQNAEEAALAGDARVRVYVGAEPEGVSVRVEDDGLGIPEEVRERVLDPLFTTKPGASGLGLTVVKRVADEHRARLDIDSLVGEGTRVRLVFPCDAAPPA